VTEEDLDARHRLIDRGRELLATWDEAETRAEAARQWASDVISDLDAEDARELRALTGGRGPREALAQQVAWLEAVTPGGHERARPDVVATVTRLLEHLPGALEHWPEAPLERAALLVLRAWFPGLEPRELRPNTTCRCHIGYTHLAHLGLYERYGDGLVARDPRLGG
jgi:hypothetical protein